MLIISIRKSFDSSNQISHYHEAKEVHLNSLTSGPLLTPDNLDNRLKGKKILLLIHGYNNEENEVLDAYREIEQRIKTFLAGRYDEIVGYSWPSEAYAIDWYPAKSKANSVAPLFRRLLENFVSQGTTIDIMSHSLGARVVLKALKPSGAILVDNYYAEAAAVDNEVLEPGEDFNSSLTSLNRIFVFHSVKDPVLANAYQVAELDKALGLTGPEDSAFALNSSQIWVINCKNVIKSHGAYKYAEAIYQYINGFTTAVPKLKTL